MTATAAKQYLMPLKYKSYEELKSNAQMDVNLIQTLKRSDFNMCLRKFFELESNARLKRQEGNEEESFILYWRAAELFKIIKSKMDKSFKQSNDGKNFHNTSDNVVISISLLFESLKLRYQNVQLNNLAITSVAKSQSIEKEKQMPTTLRDTIKPVELVRFIEKNGAFVLVLDYRRNEDQHRYIEFKSKPGKMDMVQLKTTSIIPGCLLNSLTMSLDIGVRHCFEQISQYDMIILIGDQNNVKQQNPTKLLSQALTTYNTRRPLKKSQVTSECGFQTLVVLEGGFEAWECAYPCYTTGRNEPQPSYEQTFDAKFSAWMHQSREANKLNINYPELFADKVEVQKSSNLKKSSSIGSYAPLPREKKLPTNLNVKSTTFIESMKLQDATIGDNKIADYNIVKVPEIDRTKKPASTKHLIPDNNHDNKNSSTNICHEISIPRKTHYDKNGTERSVTDDAKTINGNDKPSTNQMQVKQQTRPPPIPDTKSLHGQTQFYSQAYNMAFSKISEMSRRSKTKSGCVGLENLGNTCFMNATLQALFHTPGFSHLFRMKHVARWIESNNEFGTKGIISGCFSALIDLVYSGEFSVVNPHFFLEIFAQRVNSTLTNRQQHDAHEFQIYLLDALHEDTNRVKKRVPFEQNYTDNNLSVHAKDYFERSKMFSASPVNDIFNLTTISIVRCNLCKTSSVHFEGLNQISVELPQTKKENYGDRVIRLGDCLKTHFSETNLDAQWDCPHCESKQNATRTTSIWSLPKILIIHLKRFSLINDEFVKNEIHVDFDVDHFQLTDYMHREVLTRKSKYYLYAVVNHAGTLNRGHYTTIAKSLHNNTEYEWLNFNDSNYSRADSTALVSNHAFLLYYALEESEL